MRRNGESPRHRGTNQRSGDEVGQEQRYQSFLHAIGNNRRAGHDAELLTPDATVSHDFGRDPLSRVAGNGKTKTLSHGDDRCVDPHDATVGIDEWPTAVAGINGSRVLHDVRLVRIPSQISTSGELEDRVDRHDGSELIVPLASLRCDAASLGIANRELTPANSRTFRVRAVFHTSDRSTLLHRVIRTCASYNKQITTSPPLPR